MWLLFDAVYLLATPIVLPFVLYAVLVKGKYRSGWRERLGGVPRRAGASGSVWIHAVSLGEVNATRSLVSALRERHPGREIVLSATTQTGFDRARELYPNHIVFRYPLDFSWIVRRVLKRLRPELILLMELEVWPNLISIADARGIPVCIVNGRVTAEKSMRRFGLPLLRSAARYMFSRLACIATQNDIYAARFVELGARPDAVHVVGSIKYDSAEVSDGVAGAEEVARALGIDRARPMLVAGSTGPGEEDLLLDAVKRLRDAGHEIQLVIVPRKPERFNEVAGLIESRGIACVRRSDCARERAIEEGTPRGLKPAARLPAARLPATPTNPVVFLGDTMGELRKFYSLADVVFVGRTLVPMGGSDMMEVAGLGRPMVIGPHVENFADAAEALCAAGAAVKVSDGAGLERQFTAWLIDREAAQRAGRAGQEVVRMNAGATGRTMALIEEALGKPCG